MAALVKPRWLARVLHRLPSKVRLRTRGGTRLGHLAIGRLGEKLAAIHLRREGCKLLYRNFRSPRGGEVDLVLRDGGTLVFAEVKTRTSVRFGRPSEAVDVKKQRLIERGARAWLRQLPADLAVPLRFDVIEVVLADGEPADINWLRNMFHSSDGLAWARRTRRYDAKRVLRAGRGRRAPADEADGAGEDSEAVAAREGRGRDRDGVRDPKRDHWMPL